MSPSNLTPARRPRAPLERVAGLGPARRTIIVVAAASPSLRARAAEAELGERPTPALRGRATLDGSAPPASRRQALLDAAITLFSSRPYRDVSVDEIVETAGVAHGMVSYHFGGKRGLFSATVSFLWEDLVAFERRSRADVQPEAAVRGFLRRHFEYVHRYPERYAILAQAAQDSGDVRTILEQARVEHLTELLSMIGCRSQTPPELFAALRGWNAFLQQVTIEWARDALPEAEALVEMCLHVLVTAIAVIDGFRLDAPTQRRALSRVTETLQVEPA